MRENDNHGGDGDGDEGSDGGGGGEEEIGDNRTEPDSEFDNHLFEPAPYVGIPAFRHPGNGQRGFPPRNHWIPPYFVRYVAGLARDEDNPRSA